MSDTKNEQPDDAGPTDFDTLDLPPVKETEADRRLTELLEKGKHSSTGVEQISDAVRRLRALP
jgi:hypothetical protein